MSDSSVILPYNWQPRRYQQRLWDYLKHGGLRAVECAHRRWGKDDLCLHHTACAAHERFGNYAHMLPEYAQGRKAIWDAVNPHTGIRRIDEAFPMAIRAESGGTNEQEMKLKFRPDASGRNSTWQVVGSDSYNALMGMSMAGIVKSEESLSNPAAWGYLSPILRENNGWVIFISTPRGHNHFEALLRTAQTEKDWFWEISPADQTDVFTPQELESELRQLQELHGPEYGRALWLQEYFCSFDAAIPGSIWGEAIEKAILAGRVLDFAIERSIPVNTGWDLGRTDDTAIWFSQPNGQLLDIIAHHASNFKDIPFYVDHLLAVKEELGITYGTHWLPHDARPRTLAAGGKSILQQFEDAAKKQPDLGRFAIAPRLDRQEGIQAGRATIHRSRFHKTRTGKGFEHLKMYHRVYDQEKKVFVDVPEHDESSHDADAWRTLSVTWKFKHPAQPDSPLIDKLMRGNPATQTMGTLRQRMMDRKRTDREWANT